MAVAALTQPVKHARRRRDSPPLVTAKPVFESAHEQKVARWAIDFRVRAQARICGFGEEGEGFVHLALVESEQRLRHAAKGVKKMLGR